MSDQKKLSKTALQKWRMELKVGDVVWYVGEPGTVFDGSEAPARVVEVEPFENRGGHHGGAMIWVVFLEDSEIVSAKSSRPVYVAPKPEWIVPGQAAIRGGPGGAEPLAWPSRYINGTSRRCTNQWGVMPMPKDKKEWRMSEQLGWNPGEQQDMFKGEKLLRWAHEIIETMAPEAWDDGTISDLLLGTAKGSGNDPEAVIAIGNWNDTPEGLGDALENAGVETWWSDQSARCDGCDKAVETDPTSYSWTPGFIVTDSGEILCEGCLEDDPTELFDQIRGKAKSFNFTDLDPTKHGYVLIDPDPLARALGEKTKPFTDAKEAARFARDSGYSDFVIKKAYRDYNDVYDVYVAESDDEDEDDDADEA